MHLRDPDERIDHTVEAVERFVETAAAARRRRDRLHASTSTTSADPHRCGRCRTSWTAASSTSTPTSTRCRGEAPGLPVKLGLEVDYVGDRAGRARASARAVPVGLPARLGALDRRARGRPGARRLGGAGRWTRSGGATSRRWRSCASSATSTCSPIPTWRRSSAGGRRAASTYPALGRRRARDLDRRASASRSASSIRIPRCWRRPQLPITLASDAHVPQNVGRDFDQALELARAAGYETVTVFESRAARQEPLG